MFPEKVSITQRHINTAIHQNARNCAAAQAIKDADQDIAWVHVDSKIVEIARHSDEMRHRFATPPKLRLFIQAFDEKRAPRPLTLLREQFRLISIKPRQMRQQAKRVEIKRRRSVAKATQKPLRNVSIEEVKDFELKQKKKALAEIKGTAPSRVSTKQVKEYEAESRKPLWEAPQPEKPKVHKSRTATTGKAREPRFHRPTIREVLRAAGEDY